MSFDDEMMAVFDRAYRDSLCGASSACAGPAKSFTADEIIAAMEGMAALFDKPRERSILDSYPARQADALWPAMPAVLGGLPVRVVDDSVIPDREVPNRLHKKRRNQSLAYHKRVQKKWTKRFGTHTESCAYLIDESVLSISPCGPRRSLVVPQRHMAKLGFTL